MIRAAGLVATLCLLVALSSCVHASTIRVRPSGGAAIAAAIDRSKPADVIEIGVGTYTVTEPIKPKSGAKLIGASKEKTILRFGGERAAVLVDLSGLADVELAHLTVDGARNPLALQGILATRAPLEPASSYHPRSRQGR